MAVLIHSAQLYRSASSHFFLPRASATIMPRALRSLTTLLVLLVFAAVQLAEPASAWSGSGFLRLPEDHPQAGPQVLPARADVHHVQPTSSADSQLRRSEQERAVTRTTFPIRPGRILSSSGAPGAGAGHVNQVRVRPASLRLASAKTCDQYPALCVNGTVCCTKKCVDTKSDVNNCGGCGIPVGHGCVCCNGVIANLKTDVRNCGKCGNVCKGSKPTCSYSLCNYSS